MSNAEQNWNSRPELNSTRRARHVAALQSKFIVATERIKALEAEINRCFPWSMDK